MNGVQLFNTLVFIQVCDNNDVKSYFAKGYQYVDGELYILSGDDNIKHHISTLTSESQEYMLNKI
jgi:hypothetical protein